MKLMKRTNTYKAQNVTFDPSLCEARSYAWWVFVAKVEGNVIFNNYRYSVTTSRHQAKVRSLLNDLGISIDIDAPFPRGIDKSKSLAELCVEAEENICNAILIGIDKVMSRSERAKQRREEKKLHSSLKLTLVSENQLRGES
jgi:hypothetical protein